ncbi:DUF1579 family protein [Fulvivirga lutea]|uniref:DUF1579 family protein n=1 Tax=Fulvivirga lutea TaxID=2810512 RepID=A0A974WHB4_9BACT|nr:DUF1579 family protein [Fulvivirga lutea]QSE96110.1 DUF1579 family protein [Fulvivirga lutea]
MKQLAILLILTLNKTGAFSQGTSDLNFLLGEWKVKRIYSPNTDKVREYAGKMSSVYSLDSAFIECRFEFERPDKKKAIDLVFFNYNSLFNQYESMWLSSTWPVKVLMEGKIEQNVLSTAAQFPLGNGQTEYVRDTLEFTNNKLLRRTYITTDSTLRNWTYHLLEVSEK